MGSQAMCLQMLLAGSAGIHMEAALPAEVADLVRSLLAKSDTVGAIIDAPGGGNVVGSSSSSSNHQAASKGMDVM